MHRFFVDTRGFSKTIQKSASITVLLFLIVKGLIFGCTIKKLTGLSCPSCGMTRAWICFLNLDFKTAFYYHPLFWIAPGIIYMMAVYEKMRKKTWYVLFASLFVPLIITYILRLFVLKSPVVTFDPYKSMIYESVKAVKETIPFLK